MTNKDGTPPEKEVSLQVNPEFSWRHYALCAKQIQESPDFIDLWFQDESSIKSAVATDICFQCPVRKQCLQQSCNSKEPEGIWGGQPASIRTTGRSRAHNYQKLLGMADPYKSTNKKSKFHIKNLGESNGE